MDIIAKYNFARLQARKARIVARTIINMPARLALLNLQYRNKKAGDKLAKALASAIANAENNYKLNPDNLKVKSIIVDSGPSYRRRRARSKGRAVPILKRTSHLKVVLSEIFISKTIRKEAISTDVSEIIKPEEKSKAPTVQVRNRKDKIVNAEIVKEEKK